MSSITTNYYNTNAEAYIAKTFSIDMTPVRERFLHYLPPLAQILDVGCGSGRDSFAFISQGHTVLAIDASEAMVKATSALGITAELMCVEEIPYVSRFDGIWCSASLLHVSKADLPSVLQRLETALKPGGIVFMSFKKGQGEVLEDGRYFHFLEEEELQKLCDRFEILDLWHRSSEPNFAPVTWINLLLRKQFL